MMTVGDYRNLVGKARAPAREASAVGVDFVKKESRNEVAYTGGGLYCLTECIYQLGLESPLPPEPSTKYLNSQQEVVNFVWKLTF